ncbi:MAG: DNA/RNA non-specific endonuclease [Acidobacteria bacterium]|nr:DNA/RNA non-specific endonuclease [Acidobacteriota bacterium]
MKRALEQAPSPLPPVYPAGGEPAGGLPGPLRAHLEWASGVNLGGLRVYHNSPEPAQYRALAFLRGNAIHLAPGEDEQLPHEAWHAVQQRQGRVKPTGQIENVALNDDRGLEREAAEIGSAADRADRGSRQRSEIALPPLWPHSGEQNTYSPPSNLMQMSLEDQGSTNEKTPAGAIAGATKLKLKDLELPGTQQLGPLARPHTVKAEVSKDTLRDDERKKSANLSLVTSMARAEHVILEGYDPVGEYNAGHLVADQLVGGKDNSFELWNLAPQIEALNTPAYSSVAEEEVKKLAEADAKIEVIVKVGYPKDSYKVNIEDLIDKKVVDPAGLEKDVLDKEVEIPRRIPSTWEMTAKVLSKGKFPEAKKPAGIRTLGENFVEEEDLVNEPLTVAKPFSFTVKGAAKTGEEISLAQGPKREFLAKQRTPTQNPSEADVVSLVKKRFPGVGLDELAKILTAAAAADKSQPASKGKGKPVGKAKNRSSAKKRNKRKLSDSGSESESESESRGRSRSKSKSILRFKSKPDSRSRSRKTKKNTKTKK